MLTVGGAEVCALETAATRSTKRRGLLGRAALDGAMWFPGVRSVHTIRMQFAIDVAHVGTGGRVLRVTTMKPGRVGLPAWRAAGVLEAAAGRFAEWNLVPGVEVGVPVGGTQPGSSKQGMNRA